MKTKTLALVLFLWAPIACMGAVISVDFQNLGDGLITRDLDNSLEWLDVSETVGISKNTALSLYAGDGFRLATASEVVALYVSAGIDEVLDFGYSLGGTPIPVVGTNTDYFNVTSATGTAAISDLRALMGWTPTSFNGNLWIHGYLADENANGSSFLARFIENGGSFAAHIQTNGDIWTNTVTHGSVGSFLVRNSASVPTPQGFFLLLVGLAGLSFNRKMARQGFH